MKDKRGKTSREGAGSELTGTLGSMLQALVLVSLIYITRESLERLTREPYHLMTSPIEFNDCLFVLLLALTVFARGWLEPVRGDA